MKRTLALQRVNTMNQAAGPRDAGIPQKPGAATVRATTQAREAIARDASTHEPELPSGPEKFAPSAGEGLTSHDPLASEVSRQGDSYYFSGSLNGVAVRFRINRDVFGIKIPTRLANAAKIIAPEVQASLARQNDVISPINTISFGAYPVKSVMAKIYVDRESDVIDVGPDALASFKIKDFNGRRMLVRL